MTRGVSRLPRLNTGSTVWDAARLSANCSRRSTLNSSARIGSSAWGRIPLGLVIVLLSARGPIIGDLRAIARRFRNGEGGDFSTRRGAPDLDQDSIGPSVHC